MVFYNMIFFEWYEKIVYEYKCFFNGRFECIECDKVFVDWKCLRWYKKWVLYRNVDVFICKICGKFFWKRENLFRYEFLYKFFFFVEFYKCEYCGFCFLFGIGLFNYKRIYFNINVSEGKFDKEGSL